MSGKLQPRRNEADLMAALHPTPAVCGQPQTLAKSLIRSYEPFDRGFYAGPIGWMSGDSAEFVVAIRSALVDPIGTNHQPKIMVTFLNKHASNT
jgi:isochorismate synthase EntC